MQVCLRGGVCMWLPMETRRGSRSGARVLGICELCVLGTKPASSERALSAVNCWGIVPDQIFRAGVFSLCRWGVGSERFLCGAAVYPGGAAKEAHTERCLTRGHCLLLGSDSSWWPVSHPQSSQNQSLPCHKDLLLSSEETDCRVLLLGFTSGRWVWSSTYLFLFLFFF